MNLSLLSGVIYLGLLILIPALVLLLVWRKTKPGSSKFAFALAFVPLFAFCFGGAWFTVTDLQNRGPVAPPNAISPVGVFVLTGFFSIPYCIGGLLVIGFLMGLLRLAFPSVFFRFFAGDRKPNSP
jgi:hypothetical protein